MKNNHYNGNKFKRLPEELILIIIVRRSKKMLKKV